MSNHLRTLILGLSPDDATFLKRGFHDGRREARDHLEEIGRTFIVGYNLALDEWGRTAFARRLDDVGPELLGFAVEGAAMALTLMDLLMPWGPGRLKLLLENYGSQHAYMIHVGAGWAYARLRRRIEIPLANMDALLRWLVADGYGFHEGYFHTRNYVALHGVSKRLSGYALRAFDQGLGRSLWFVCGADHTRLASAVRGYPSSRWSDLWSGIGLACAYAGGATEAAIVELARISGSNLPDLAQGAAFAAKARLKAGNPAGYTDLACRLLCSMPASTAGTLTDAALKDLPADGPEPAYEVWRQRVRSTWGDGGAGDDFSKSVRDISWQTASSHSDGNDRIHSD